MSTPSLPNELLAEIFEHLSSSSSNLFHLLLSSRSFIHAVKAILYRHITITTRAQRSGLASIRKEDSLRVRKVTIIVDGPIRTAKLDLHFTGVNGCKLGGGCVLDLLVGSLLDISVLETLHVRYVHEDPSETLFFNASQANFKAATKLSELSIWNHHGGGPLWNSYLGASGTTTPALRRLGFAQVTHFKMEDRDLDDFSDEYCCEDCSGPIPTSLVKTVQRLGKEFSSLFPQLETLVAECPRSPLSIPALPRDHFLALLHTASHRSRDPTRQMTCVRLSYSWNTSLPDFLDLFKTLFSTDDSQVRHLFLPPRPNHVTVEEYEEKISEVQSKGCEVHRDLDGDEADPHSLIVPSFVRFLEQAGNIASA
ncbi:hypothetical protein JCM16303_006944 [Sporobolomyces ruberrimus]